MIVFFTSIYAAIWWIVFFYVSIAWVVLKISIYTLAKSGYTRNDQKDYVINNPA